MSVVLYLVLYVCMCFVIYLWASFGHLDVCLSFGISLVRSLCLSLFLYFFRSPSPSLFSELSLSSFLYVFRSVFRYFVMYVVVSLFP